MSANGPKADVPAGPVPTPAAERRGHHFQKAGSLRSSPGQRILVDGAVLHDDLEVVSRVGNHG
jgi:hypothetical protein